MSASPRSRRATPPLMIHAQGARQEAARLSLPEGEEDTHSTLSESHKAWRKYIQSSPTPLMRPVTLVKELEGNEIQDSVVVSPKDSADQLLPFWNRAKKDQGHTGTASTAQSEGSEFNFPSPQSGGEHHVRVVFGFLSRQQGSYTKTTALPDESGLMQHLRNLPGVKEDQLLFLDGHMAHSTNKRGGFLRVTVKGPVSFPRVHRCFPPDSHSHYNAAFIRTWSDVDGEIFGSGTSFIEASEASMDKDQAKDLATLYKQINQGNLQKVSQEHLERPRRFTKVELKTMRRFVFPLATEGEYPSGNVVISFEDLHRSHTFDPTTNLKKLMHAESEQLRIPYQGICFTEFSLQDSAEGGDATARAHFEKMFEVLNYSGYSLPSAAVLPQRSSESKKMDNKSEVSGKDSSPKTTCVSNVRTNSRDNSRATTGDRRSQLNRTLANMTRRSTDPQEDGQSTNNPEVTVTLQASNALWEDLKLEKKMGFILFKKGAKEWKGLYPTYTGPVAPKFGGQTGESSEVSSMCAHFTKEQSVQLAEVYSTVLCGLVEKEKFSGSRNSLRLLLGPATYREGNTEASSFRSHTYFSNMYNLNTHKYGSKETVVRKEGSEKLSRKTNTLFIQFAVNGKLLQMSEAATTWLESTQPPQSLGGAVVLRPNCDCDVQASVFQTGRPFEDAFPNATDRERLRAIGMDCLRRVGKAVESGSISTIESMVLIVNTNGANNGRDSHGTFFSLDKKGQFKWFREMSFGFDGTPWRHVNTIRGISEVTQELRYDTKSPQAESRLTSGCDAVDRCFTQDEAGVTVVSTTRPIIECIQSALEFLDEVDPPMRSQDYVTGGGKHITDSTPVALIERGPIHQKSSPEASRSDTKTRRVSGSPKRKKPDDSTVSALEKALVLQHGSSNPQFNLPLFLQVNLDHAVSATIASIMLTLKEHHVSQVSDLYAAAAHRNSPLRHIPALAPLFQEPSCEAGVSPPPMCSSSATFSHLPDTPLRYHRSQILELCGLTGVVVCDGELSVRWDKSPQEETTAGCTNVLFDCSHTSSEWLSDVSKIVDPSKIFVDSEKQMVVLQNTWTKQQGVGILFSKKSQEAGYWNPQVPPSHFHFPCGTSLPVTPKVSGSGSGPRFTASKVDTDRLGSPLFANGLLAAFAGCTDMAPLLSSMKFRRLKH